MSMNISDISYEKHIEITNNLIAEINQLKSELMSIKTNVVDPLIKGRNPIAASEARMAELLAEGLVMHRRDPKWEEDVKQVLYDRLIRINNQS